MDINTLNYYLSELKTLRTNYTFQDRKKAIDLQTKIMDALKELNLYDVASVRVGHLNFKFLSSYIPDPYYESLDTLISHLESKIEVHKHRVQIATKKAEQARQQSSSIHEYQLEMLTKSAKISKEILEQKEEEISTLKSTISGQYTLLADKDAKINRKMLIWKITSGTIWGIIISSCIGVSVWTYDLGKDNATKDDDTEKASLRGSNKGLQHSINMLLLDIDSLKHDIDSLKKINKKG